MARFDMGHEVITSAYPECCTLCKSKSKTEKGLCVAWSWHPSKPQGGECHFHNRANASAAKAGVISGYVNGTR
jgi:hypothetical protein